MRRLATIEFVVAALTALCGLAAPGPARAAEAEGARQFHPDVEKHLDKVPPLLRDTRPPVPKDQDAYPILCEAARKLTKLGDKELEDAFWRVNNAEEGFPGGETGRRLKDWLDTNKAALDLFDSGLERGRCRFPGWLDTAGRDQLGVEFGESLRGTVVGFSRIKIVRAKMLVSAGDQDRAANELVQLLRIAQFVNANAAGIWECLQGTTCHALSCKAIEWLTRQPLAAREPLEGLLSAMKAAPLADEDLANAFRAEFRSSLLAALDMLVKDIAKQGLTEGVWADAVEKARTGAKGTEGEAVVKAFLEKSPHPLDVAATIQLAAPFYVRAIKCAGGSWSARDRTLGTDADKWADTLKEENKRSVENLRKLAASLKAPTPEFAQALSKALDNFAGREIAWKASPNFTGILWEYSFRARARHEATRALLALRIYSLKHKQLPPSLDALVEDKILPSVPRDLFADKPLRYSRDKGIIWSVGPNEVDEGGDKIDQGDSKGPRDIVWEIPFAKREEGAKRE